MAILITVRVPLLEKFKPIHKLTYKITGIGLIGGKEMPDAMRKEIVAGIPDRQAFFTHITTDEQDLIYVFAPDVGNKERQQIDIFSHDGTYFYNGIVELEKRIQKVGPFVLNGEDLYTKAESENKNVRTVRYGIKIPKLNKEKSK